MVKQLIKCENLAKVYISDGGTKTFALRDGDLIIERGEFVAIMGPSGSGKSTLMHILGLLDRPTSGKYWFDGRDTADFDDATLASLRNQSLGFVFQAFNLLPRISVTDNVALPLMYDRRGVSRKQRQRRVSIALETVGLAHRQNYYTNQLSGGEQQRVAIARALVNNPEVIFADEPTGNLDSASGLVVMKVLQKLNDAGKTIIMVTHETATAAHAKRILRLRDGRIVGDETISKRKVASNDKAELK